MSAPACFMQQAQPAGRSGLPGCLPNPPLGCVLVKARQIVGQGFTQRPGEPHAGAGVQIPGEAGILVLVGLLADGH